jgi:hypothetical protein
MCGPERIDPLCRAQVAVPGQQRGWSNDPLPTQLPGELAGQGDFVTEKGTRCARTCGQARRG